MKGCPAGEVNEEQILHQETILPTAQARGRIILQRLPESRFAAATLGNKFQSHLSLPKSRGPLNALQSARRFH